MSHVRVCEKESLYDSRNYVKMSDIPWSSRYGSESPSLEVSVNVGRYAVLELHARNNNDNVVLCLEWTLNILS